jgi:hypothetical protein
MPTYARRQIVVEDQVGVYPASLDAAVEPSSAASTRIPGRTIVTAKKCN